MKGFITVTVLPQKNLTTIALHVIGIVTSEEIRSSPSTTLVLSFGSSGKTVYSVAESYEEVLKLIEAAQ